MAKNKRWAAIDSQGDLIRVGSQPGFYKFDKRVFRMSAGGYLYWIAEGARYCQIPAYGIDGIQEAFEMDYHPAKEGEENFSGFFECSDHPQCKPPWTNIKNIPHNRIRVCKDVDKRLLEEGRRRREQIKDD